MTEKKNRSLKKIKKTILLAESSQTPIDPQASFSKGTPRYVLWVAVVVFAIFLWKKNSLFDDGVLLNLKLFKKDFPVREINHIALDKLKGGPFNIWGICDLGKDGIAASDDLHTKLLVFDGKGKLQAVFGQRGPEKEKKALHQLRGISSDSKGDLYVLDTQTAFIFGFTPLGKPLGMIDTSPTGFFYGPLGLWCVGNNFAIADTGSHRIVTVSPDGKEVSKWGDHGTGRNDFQSPKAVLVDSQNHYYVADYDNERVKIQDSKGKVLKIISLGNKPEALALDHENRLYVSFGNEKFIQVYSAETGDYIGDVTVQNPEQDPSYRRVGALCVTGDDHLVAADAGNIWIYQLTSVGK